jgi:hypothetical protein
MQLSLQLNGKRIEVESEPQETLAEVLRNSLNLNGTKVSCEVQVCGACTVLVDGIPVSAVHIWPMKRAAKRSRPLKDWKSLTARSIHCSKRSSTSLLSSAATAQSSCR